MTHVLVAHAPEETARAMLVANKLDALGYKVLQDGGDRRLSPFERRKLKADIDKAACVLVLWSREAADAPALRAAAERAAASGKLALARLDAAPPPMGFAANANLTNWMGRETRAWRQLVTSIGPATRAPASARSAARAVGATPAPERAKKKGGGGGMLLGAFVCLLAAVAVGYYFFVM